VSVGREGQLAIKWGENEYSTVFGGPVSTEALALQGVFGGTYQEQLTTGVHYVEVELRGRMMSLFVGIARPGLDTAERKSRAYKECMDVWFMQAYSGGLCGSGKGYDDKAGGFKAGDRVGMLVDLDRGSLLFFKNGEQHGPGYGAGSVTGPVVLALQMRYEGQSGRVVADAVMPSGFYEGLGRVVSVAGLEALLSAAGKEEVTEVASVEAPAEVASVEAPAENSVYVAAAAAAAAAVAAAAAAAGAATSAMEERELLLAATAAAAAVATTAPTAPLSPQQPQQPLPQPVEKVRAHTVFVAWARCQCVCALCCSPLLIHCCSHTATLHILHFPYVLHIG
jgi:hypothetical protein